MAEFLNYRQAPDMDAQMVQDALRELGATREPTPRASKAPSAQDALRRYAEAQAEIAAQRILDEGEGEGIITKWMKGKGREKRAETARQQTMENLIAKGLYEQSTPSAANRESFGAPTYVESVGDEGQKVLEMIQAGNRGTIRDVDLGGRTPVLPGAMAAYNESDIIERDTAELVGAVNEALAVGDIEKAQNIAEYAAKSGINIDEAIAMIDVESAKTSRLADEQHQRKLNTDMNRRQGMIDAADQKHHLVDSWIDEAIGNANAYTTGFWGNKLAYFEGTPAFDLVSTVDSIKANIGFDKLQDMRANSPTGGALGQVSEFENRLLQATLGNLATSQSKEQFTKNLETLKEQLDQIVNRGISSFERDYGEGSSGAEMQGIELKAVDEMTEEELEAEELRLKQELGME